MDCDVVGIFRDDPVEVIFFSPAQLKGKPIEFRKREKYLHNCKLTISRGVKICTQFFWLVGAREEEWSGFRISTRGNDIV
jgi:hypothetical protein